MAREKNKKLFFVFEFQITGGFLKSQLNCFELIYMVLSFTLCKTVINKPFLVLHKSYLSNYNGQESRIATTEQTGHNIVLNALSYA